MAAFAAHFRLYRWDGEQAVKMGSPLESRQLMTLKETTMKHSNIAKTFAFAAVAALALAMAPAAKADDKGCTNATVRGTFAYTSTGSITAPDFLAGPFAEVGTQTFDGRGGTTAVVMASQNGNILPLTVTGTYTVNSDCTGTMTLQVSPIAVTVDIYFVIDDGGNGFQAIETDAGLVITRIGRRLFPGSAI